MVIGHFQLFDIPSRFLRQNDDKGTRKHIKIDFYGLLISDTKSIANKTRFDTKTCAGSEKYDFFAKNHVFQKKTCLFLGLVAPTSGGLIFVSF